MWEGDGGKNGYGTERGQEEVVRTNRKERYARTIGVGKEVDESRRRGA